MGTHLLHLPFSLHRPASLKSTAPLTAHTSSTLSSSLRTNPSFSPLVATPLPSKESSSLICKVSEHNNVEVFIGEDEPDEEIIQRFRREVLRSNILRELRRRKRHEDPRDKRKRRMREAARSRSRWRRRSDPEFRSGSRGKYPEDGAEDRSYLDDGNWQMPARP